VGFRRFEAGWQPANVEKSKTVEENAGGTSLKEPLVSSRVPGNFLYNFSGGAGKGFVNGGLRLFSICFSSKLRGGSRVVAVFLFEVVEPFFSRAAAPQHIPS
jgi:hypothetical protein